jgi:hypothetical protein
VEKTFMQALIQIAAAFHHLGRGNLRGARSLMSTALKRLQDFSPSFQGVAVAELRVDLGNALGALDGKGDVWQGEVGLVSAPRISVLPPDAEVGT